MAALTTALLALSAAKTVGDFAGQRRAAGIAEQEGDFEGGQLDQNASLVEAQGRSAASQVQREGRQLMGSQRAAYAAQGLDTTTGSPADVMSSDARLSELDRLTIMNNAAREAWGYRAQATYARAAGRNRAAALRNQSIGTLLSGVGDLANTYAAAPHGVSRFDRGLSSARDYVSNIDTKKLNIPRYGG